MKLFKLIVHQRGFYGAEDLIINPKDFPGIKKGSIVEIYHPEDEFSRLLLQITCLKEDLQLKETISVEQSIASAFQLRTYADVHVDIVNPENVALDSVELTFKDQYLGRSEMWRLKNNLVNTCVYLNKKIEFCSGSVRCQVYEMWSQGDRVACGVITDDTKVVFRSSTSMVYLFIQMSSEMWDFDIHGDLYFEKAVNGFLADLFQKWKKNGSNHEVTIVLFSRTFYKASNLEEFPGHMRECLQQDYRGRFYEDFYRVAVQNERYEDWTNTLVQLRRLFTDYQKIVLEYHKRPGIDMPKAVNSTAAQGNFLEVLNMSLNVFEKHYLDRSFDRTGQLSVVITPGVGVFEVDRELTNVTKQRIIDNGVGSDLVCVGEQPLHAVPLLKFHNKDTSSFSTVDDYSMPHWINLSFYSNNKKVAYSNFIPRIKLPPRRSKPPPAQSNGIIQAAKSKLLQEDECMPNSLFDYDAYDAQVFQLPPVNSTRFSRSLQRMNSRNKKGSTGDALGNQKMVKRKMSDPDIHHISGGIDPIVVVIGVGSPGAGNSSRSAAITIPQNRVTELSPPQSASVGIVAQDSLRQRSFTVHGELEADPSPPLRPVVGSAGSPSNTPQPPCSISRPGRALINPFDPSHVTIKLTSNRRRWTHIFPKGPTGVLIQQHHYQAVPTGSTTDHVHEGVQMFGSSPGTDHTSISGSIPRSSSQTTFQDGTKSRGCGSRPTSQVLEGVRPAPGGKSLTLLWGATGEQEWTPALTTVDKVIIGVDWKSLTIPACLPITTDYFPDKRSLQNDYLVSDYNLLPDDVNADFAQQRAIYKKPLTTAEVFRELVSQRLAQGFQLIVLYKPTGTQPAQTPGSTTAMTVGSSVVMTRPKDMEPTEEYLLSIGRIFHKISLSGSSITVTRYRPRHPYPPFNIHYRYRFHAPHHDTYEVSWVSFTTEKLENFNWNYLDHYICTRGDVDFALAEAQKYWRFRVYVVPLNQQDTKKILDGAEHCDVYSVPSPEEEGHILVEFLRFIETWVNRIRRPSHKNAKARSPASQLLSFGPLQGGATGSRHKPIHRRHSTSTISPSQSSNTAPFASATVTGVSPQPGSQTSVVGNSPFRERLGSNRVLEKPRPRSGSKVMERVKADGTSGSGRVSPASEAATNDRSQQGSTADSVFTDLHSHAESQDDSQNSELRLKSTAGLGEILESMRHPEKGVGFLMHHPSLPSYTFVSADAVQWLIAHMDGIQNEEQAMSIMERMLLEKMVCHASGDFNHPFIVGFYLYHVVQQAKDKDTEYLQPLGDLQSFENEWLELEVRHPTGWQRPTPSVPGTPTEPAFLADVLQEKVCLEDSASERNWSVPLYKHTHLEIDINNKSDRVEWGHARYQSVYRPDRAYELVAQWVTSSGPIVADLINVWSRKALLCGLQMVPIPADPLALPFTHKSDPLRGPIFVPLDTESLMGSKSYLFEEFSEHSWDQRLLLFQEAIIKRFGFIACTVETPRVGSPTSSKGSMAHYHQYVHLTGNVFILIPTQPCQPTMRSNSVSTGRPVSVTKALGARRYPVHSDVSSPHEEYITRHVSGKNQNDYSTEPRIGFLWSWNHMISRRWKSAATATGDEMFQMKILRDFREFCANADNRLRNFWDSCWNQKSVAQAKKS